MTLSITTVCRNNPAELARTLRSIGGRFETIVQDGSDDDGCERMAAGFGLTARREPDGGLFDAMNRAARQTSGVQILALNAGDELYDSLRLKALVDVHRDAAADSIVYGDHVASIGGRRILLKAPQPSSRNLMIGTLPCHQAVLLPRWFVLQEGYDASLRFAADSKLLIRAFETLRPLYLPEPLAIFTHGGISNVPGDWASVFDHYRANLAALNYPPHAKAGLFLRLAARKLGMAFFGRESLMAWHRWRALGRRGAIALDDTEAQAEFEDVQWKTPPLPGCGEREP